MVELLLVRILLPLLAMTATITGGGALGGITSISGMVLPGQVVATAFNGARSLVTVGPADTTLLTTTFSLAAATNIIVDWRVSLGVVAATTYGNLRLVVDSVIKSRTSRYHFGQGSGYAMNLTLNGPCYLGSLAASSHTISLIWYNETANQATYNPNATDSGGWSQADSEMIVRGA